MSPKENAYGPLLESTAHFSLFLPSVKVKKVIAGRAPATLCQRISVIPVGSFLLIGAGWGTSGESLVIESIMMVSLDVERS
jgi:hypothetical protein